MNKQKWLKVINPILLILALSQAATGLGGEHLSRETFEVVHKGGGLLLAGLAIVHLILNWNWVKSSYFKRSSG